jgi:hypothetical protein
MENQPDVESDILGYLSGNPSHMTNLKAGDIKLSKLVFSWAVRACRMDILNWLENLNIVPLINNRETLIEVIKDTARICTLAILRWLCGKFMVAAWEIGEFVLKEAIFNNNLEVLQWLCTEFILDRKIIKHTFIEAAVHGKIEVVDWLFSTFSLTKKELKSDDGVAFKYAAAHGHLNVLQWLSNHLLMKDMKNGVQFAFNYAAKHGHLEVLRWLHSTFKISKKKARGEDLFAFRYAAYGNHHYVLDWLSANFPFKSRRSIRKAIRFAAAYDNPKFADWLHSIFQLTERDARKGINNVFVTAANHGSVDMMDWVHEKFPITKADLSYGYAAARGNKHILAHDWIHAHNYPRENL